MLCVISSHQGRFMCLVSARINSVADTLTLLLGYENPWGKMRGKKSLSWGWNKNFKWHPKHERRIFIEVTFKVSSIQLLLLLLLESGSQGPSQASWGAKPGLHPRGLQFVAGPQRETNRHPHWHSHLWMISQMLLSWDCGRKDPAGVASGEPRQKLGEPAHYMERFRGGTRHFWFKILTCFVKAIKSGLVFTFVDINYFNTWIKYNMYLLKVITEFSSLWCLVKSSSFQFALYILSELNSYSFL